ncbi:MAG: hypothetical protein JXA67_16345 [Micromonosporaceae bacterium]|nr:hypothetical protein [Micromonosporaceae bacterium]
MADQYSEAQIQAAVEAFAAGAHIEATGVVEVPPPLVGEPMVMRGVRLPLGMDQRVKAAAEQAGVSFSTLVRQWIELGLSEMEDDRTVSLAAIRRAIAHAAVDRAA